MAEDFSPIAGCGLVAQLAKNPTSHDELSLVKPASKASESFHSVANSTIQPSIKAFLNRATGWTFGS
jgi:hypothetical protein